MARAMLLAVACAALASGARYVDYSGVKMPQYGGSEDYDRPRDIPNAPMDDYRDHSPDAPASLDYEDDPSGSTDKSRSQVMIEGDVEDSELWQKPQKKEKRPTHSDDDANLETLDKYSPEEMIPKFKTNNRFSRRRHRLKARNPERDSSDRGDLPLKQPSKYVRSKSDDSDVISEDNFHLRQDNIREDKNDAFDNSKRHFGYRETTVRVKARRKPRDRSLAPPIDDDDLDILEDLSIKNLEKEERRDSDYLSGNEGRRQRPEGPEAPIRQASRRLNLNNEDLDPPLKMSKIKPKNYDEDDAYYDMKRANNIKNKLPSLLRRTTKTTTLYLTPTTTTLRREDIIWPNRRLVPQPASKKQEESTTTSTTTTTTMRFSIKTATARHISQKPKEELSLAEKSRLSILKKAQRKESFANGTTTTKKPPVLLQVANQMQTIVMVEPPSTEEPMLRAREISEDTSDRLNLVKRMMRHKLVSNAKNIQDLTDNWDDLVCDYIDLSMLQQDSAMFVSKNVLLIYLMLVLLIIPFR